MGLDPQGEGLSESSAADVRTVAKGGAVQIAGQIASRGLGYLFLAVSVRILGTAGYGLYRQVTQILNIAGGLAPGGFNYAAVRYIAKARAQKEHGGVKGAIWIALAGGTICSGLAFGIVFLGAGAIASSFADSPAKQDFAAFLLRLGAAYVPLYAIQQVLRFATQAYKTMVPAVIIANVIQPGVRFILGAALLLAGFTLAGVMASLVASAAISVVAAALYLRRMMNDKERNASPIFETSSMTRFALPQAGVHLFSVHVLGLGIVLLGILSGDVQVGLFGIALSLQSPGRVFLTGIVQIWAPVVTDLYESGHIARLNSLYQTINRWVATFSFPFFAALIVLPEPFVRILSGDERAASLAAILAVGNFFFTGTGPCSYVLSMTGRPGLNLVNSIVAMALYAGLGVWLVPQYGAAGMAIVDSLVSALINVARVVEVKLLVGVQPYGRSYAKPVAATLLLTLVLMVWRLLPGDGYALEVAGLAVGTAAYLGALWGMGLDAEERHVFERIRSRLFKAGKR